MTDALRVVVLDDHALFHQALVAWLGADEPDIEVGYAGEDWDLALAAAPGCDVVLLDLDLGRRCPAAAVAGLAVPGAPAAGCSSSARWAARAWCARGWPSGALGYMSKREQPADLVTAIRTVAEGQDFLTPEMAAILAEAPEDVPNLSIQELTALRLYASGMKLDSVARRMNVSPGDRQGVPGPRARQVRAGAPTGALEVRHAPRRGRGRVPATRARSHAALHVNRPRLAASLLSLAAVVAIGLVLAAPGGLRWQAHPGTACEDLAALSESLDLSSLGDQAVIRARAVQLAAALKVSTADGGEGAVTTDEELQLRRADPSADGHRRSPGDRARPGRRSAAAGPHDAVSSCPRERPGHDRVGASGAARRTSSASGPASVRVRTRVAVGPSPRSRRSARSCSGTMATPRFLTTTSP